MASLEVMSITCQIQSEVSIKEAIIDLFKKNKSFLAELSNDRMIKIKNEIQDSNFSLATKNSALDYLKNLRSFKFITVKKHPAIKRILAE